MRKSWKHSKSPIRAVRVRNLDIQYRVVHRRLKYPRLEFEPDGKLLVILPVDTRDEKELLNRKEDWIWKKAKEISRSINYANKYEKIIGRKHIIFGSFYDVKFDTGKYNIRTDNDKIEVTTPNRIGALIYLKQWLKKELIKKIYSYLDQFSKELGSNYNKVFIRTQKTKWASCSSRGNLSFNLKLAALPEELIRYVILHETVHFQENHHNENFWKLVEKYFTDYREKEILLTGFWFLIEKDKLWKSILRTTMTPSQ